MTGTGVACKMTGCSPWKTDQANTLWLPLGDRHGVGHHEWTPAEGHVGFPSLEHQRLLHSAMILHRLSPPLRARVW